MKKQFLLIACMSLGFGLVAQPIELNDIRWFRNGPNGTYVTSMANAPSNPDVIYLGTIANGVYKTTNGGASWDLCNRDNLLVLPEEYSSAYGPMSSLHLYGDYEPVELIKVDPVNPEIVWAAFYDNGVYKSIDGGNNWEKQGEGIIDDLWISAIDINPDDPDDVLVGGYALYRSVDGGDTWSIVEQVPNGDGKNTLGIYRDPNNFEHIWVCIDYNEIPGDIGRMLETFDYGETWETINGVKINSLVIDVENDNKMWASKMNSMFEPHLAYSTDGGHSWDFYTEGLFSGKRVKDVFLDGNFNLYAVIEDDGWRYINWLVKSSDHGETWSEFGCLYTLYNLEFFSRGYSNKLVVMPSENGEFYVGGISGLQRLDQTADGFVPANSNLTNSHVSNVMGSSLDSDLIYAGGKQGLFKSTDGGISWSVIHLFPDLEMALNPFDEQVLFAYNDTIFKTENGGQTFQTITFDYGYTLYDIAFHPTEQNVLYILCSYGIYKSTDQGENWELLSDEIYANSESKIVFDISHPDTMYCGYNVTYDGGETWSLFSTYHQVKAVHPTQSNILFAGSFNIPDLFKSVDYGETFTTIGDSSVSSGNFVIDQSNPDYVFISWGNGMKYSPDCGDTWHYIECSFDGAVRQIIPNVEENRFIVATHGDGVWVYDESMNDIEEFATLRESSNQIHVYPNPFTERVNISFTVQERSDVTVEVFDSNGKQVATIFNGFVNPSKQEITWDRSEGGIPAGVYLIRLKNNSIVEYQKGICY